MARSNGFRRNPRNANWFAESGETHYGTASIWQLGCRRLTLATLALLFDGLQFLLQPINFPLLKRLDELLLPLDDLVLRLDSAECRFIAERVKITADSGQVFSRAKYQGR